MKRYPGTGTGTGMASEAPPAASGNGRSKNLAFVLANCLQKVIGKLISLEQIVYIKECCIGQNIRSLLDILDYTKIKQNLLLFLDFEKAFNSLNWNFMDKCVQNLVLEKIL